MTAAGSTVPTAAPSAAARLAGSAALVAAFAAAPLVLGTYPLHALIISMIFLLPAHGLNLILGYTGMLSLAQGAFFGIGAYTSALLAIHAGTPFWFNFVAAGLVGSAVALPLAVPALRLRTYSFVMCTLAFVLIAETVSKNWIGLTRGDMGLSGIPRPELGIGPLSIPVTTTTGFYYLALVVVALTTAVFYAIVSSPAGRCMIAIRDNETLAESFGIPTWTYKLVVFTLSAAFAGMGGSLYAHYLTVVSPLTFQMYYTTTILIIVLGGGTGTVRGVVLGSLVFVAASEALRITPELRMIIYGFVLLGLVFWFPTGLFPLVDRVLGALRGRSP
ncbi:MAG: branched-chain amino acid ABC transporter permease [Alphaproteobacteria bacterium]|nr:branched-chain amino acid ABC transporter permease [Alphaproteobacteria bacterium]